MSTTYAMRATNKDKLVAALTRAGITLERHPDAKPKDVGWYVAATPNGFIHFYSYVTPKRKLERFNMFERFGGNQAEDVCDALDEADIEWASEYDDEYERLLGRCA
jgi:hypothetical protein